MSKGLIPTFASLGITLNITEEPKAVSHRAQMVSDGSKRVMYKPKSGVTFIKSGEREASGWYPDGPKMVIDPYISDIISMIDREPVSALSLTTGSGKTRRIPPELAIRKYRVRVAVPTVVAAKESYNFVKKYTNLHIGWAYGRSSSYNSDTELVYATTGHIRGLLQRLLGRGGDVQKEARKILGDLIFIDEVHTGTRDITTLIGLIAYIFPDPRDKMSPKIVFSSATFNNGDILHFYSNFPIYKIDLDTFPKSITYVDRPETNIDDLIADVIRKELNGGDSRLNGGDSRLNGGDSRLNGGDSRLNGGDSRLNGGGGARGSGIIFRPGVAEVLSTVDAIERQFPSVAVFPAYSQLSEEDLEAIFRPAPSGTMKIVVGTNIIESSITISDAVWVIDDLLVKTAETSSTGGNRLVLGNTTQAESEQRAGRVGRTGPGRVYRLGSEAMYSQLPPFRTREIERVPIEDIVLQLIDIHLSPVQILRISPERYALAEQILLQMKMVVIKGSQLQLTEIGHFVSQVPLGVQNAALVYYGYKDYMLDPTNTTAQIQFRSILALAAMLEIGPGQQGFFFIPRKTKDETPGEYKVRKDTHIEKYHEKYRGRTDIHTLINIFWGLMIGYNVAQSYDLSASRGFTDYVREYCRNNMLNNRKIREMLIVLDDLEYRTLQYARLPSDIQPGDKPEPKSKPIDLRRVLPEVDSYAPYGNTAALLFAEAYNNNTLLLSGESRGQPVYSLSTDTRARPTRYILAKGFSQLVSTRQNPIQAIVAAELTEIAGPSGTFFTAGIFVDF